MKTSKCFRRFTAVLLILVLILTAFPLTASAKTQESDPAERLLVQIGDKNQEHILKEIYSLEELKNISEVDPVFYSSVDQMPAAVITVARGVRVDKLIEKVLKDTGLEGNVVKDLKLNSTDGYLKTLTTELLAVERKFYPSLYEGSGDITSGAVTVYPLLALESYQGRYDDLKTECANASGKTETEITLEDVKTYMISQMDATRSFRYCEGQTLQEAQYKIATASNFSKWTYNILIGLETPLEPATDKVESPVFNIKQNQTGDKVYVNLSCEDKDADIYYSIYKGDGDNDFRGFIPQTKYEGTIVLDKPSTGILPIKAQALKQNAYSSVIATQNIENKEYETASATVSTFSELQDAVAKSASGDVISLAGDIVFASGEALDITDKNVTIENASNSAVNIKSGYVSGSGIITFEKGINFAGQDVSNADLKTALNLRSSAHAIVNGDIAGADTVTESGGFGLALVTEDCTAEVIGNIRGGNAAQNAGGTAVNIKSDQPATSTGSIYVKGNVTGGEAGNYADASLVSSFGNGICIKNGVSTFKVTVDGNVTGGRHLVGNGIAGAGLQINGNNGTYIVNGTVSGGRSESNFGGYGVALCPGATGTNDIAVTGNVSGGYGYVRGGIGIYHSGRGNILINGDVSGGNCDNSSNYGGGGYSINGTSLGGKITVKGNVTGGSGYVAASLLMVSNNSALENLMIDITGNVTAGASAVHLTPNEGIGISSNSDKIFVNVKGNVTGEKAGISGKNITVTGNVEAKEGSSVKEGIGVKALGTIKVTGDVKGKVTGVTASASQGNTSVIINGNITGTQYGAIAAQKGGYTSLINYSGTVSGITAATGDDAVSKAFAGSTYALGTYRKLYRCSSSVTGGTATVRADVTESVIENTASKGELVTLNISDLQSGYSVKLVSASAGEKEVELTKVSDSQYTFAMPESDVSINISLNYSGSSSGTGGGSGGGGGGGGGSTLTQTPSNGQIKSENGISKAVSETSAAASGDGTGVAKASVASTALSSALKQAMESAASNDTKAGSKEGTTGVEVKVEVSADKNAKTVETALPADTLKEMAKQENAQLTVNTPIAAISLDQDALAAITDKAGSKVTISAEKVDTSSLSAATKEKIGDAPVYDLKVMGESGAISDFKGGKATVSVPYELKQGESPSQVAVYYVNDAGEMVKMNCTYDSTTKTATFTTNHFSYYAVMIEDGAAKFTDISKSAYYYDAVNYVVKQGLFNGTGDTTFSPGTGMTRAMFVTALGRASGVKASDYTKSSFTDVTLGSWYGAYVQWAYENKIITGFGSDLFAPDQQITRDQMAAILTNYSKWKGTGPTAEMSVQLTYTDASGVPAWAKEGVMYCTMKGWLTGYPDGSFLGDKTATRAEAATVLYKGIK